MKDETEQAERDLRKAVDRLGHELTGLTVDDYDGEAVINLEVTVEHEAENEYRVK